MAKKIAVQFFGHLRTFSLTFGSFKKHFLEANRLDGYEIDIFIHTWDELDHSTVNYRNPNGVALTDKKLLPSDVHEAEKLYDPRLMVVESQLSCDEKIIVERMGGFKRSIKGCLNMAYTLYKSSQIRRKYEEENGVDYEWVVVTRPDILFKKEFRLKGFLQSHNDLHFEIPKDGIFCGFNPFGRGNKIEEPQFLTGSDLIYFAKPANIDAATSLYTRFEENIDPSNFYCMEIWWAMFWRKMGLRAYFLDFKHGPDFDVIKTNVFSAQRIQGDYGVKVYERELEVFGRRVERCFEAGDEVYRIFPSRRRLLTIKTLKDEIVYYLFGRFPVYRILYGPDHISHFLFRRILFLSLGRKNG